MESESLGQHYFKGYSQLTLHTVEPIFKSTKCSGDWINAISVANVSALLSLNERYVSIALRVGADKCTSLNCLCSRILGSIVLHHFSCHRNADHFALYAELNLILKNSVVRANVPSILEPFRLSKCDGKRLDGLTLCS